MKSSSFFPLAAAFMALTACSSSSPTTPAGDGTSSTEPTPDAGESTTPGSHTVTVSDFSYTPSSITINAGESIDFVFKKGTHSVTSGTNCTKDRVFDSGTKNAGATWSHTFETPGTFTYFCDFRDHCTGRGQVGTVIVR